MTAPSRGRGAVAVRVFDSCVSDDTRIERWTFAREQVGCFESTPSRVGNGRESARVGHTAGVKCFESTPSRVGNGRESARVGHTAGVKALWDALREGRPSP
jgi:hypothetical protein